MRRPCFGVLVLVTALALPEAARAVEFADLISGKIAPLSIALKELTPEWRRLSVGADGRGASGLAGFYSAWLGGGAGQAYYTRGQTVTCGDQTFIVAYRAPTQDLDFGAIMLMQRGSKPPEPAPLTADTVLSLALLHLQSLGSLTEVRPFDLARELAEAAEAQQSRSAMVESMGGARTRAVSTSSMANLKQLGLAVAMYVQDHGKFLPTLTDAAAARNALKGYLEVEGAFVHPQTHEAYLPNASLSGKSMADVGANASRTVVFYEASAGGDAGRAVLFLDGHVEQVNAARWDELRRTSGVP